MTLRVTKEGQIPGDREMIGTCYHCKTEVECLQADADSSTDRNETCFTVACPLKGCFSNIILTHKNKR